MAPKCKLSASQHREIEDMYAQNVSQVDIGKKYGVSRHTVRNILKDRGVKLRKLCVLPDDSQLISLKVPKEMLSQLRVVAKESGISVADVVRGLIEASINQLQAEVDRLQEDKEYWDAYEAAKRRMNGGDDDWV